MPTPPPHQDPSADDDQPVRSTRTPGDSSDRIVVNWGFGLIPPSAINQPRAGVETTRPLTTALSDFARRATHWTLRRFAGLSTLPWAAHKSRDQHRSDQSRAPQG
jgi:hypothetical protein